MQDPELVITAQGVQVIDSAVHLGTIESEKRQETHRDTTVSHMCDTWLGVSPALGWLYLC